jgi:hypothetical protein
MKLIFTKINIAFRDANFFFYVTSYVRDVSIVANPFLCSCSIN